MTLPVCVFVFELTEAVPAVMFADNEVEAAKTLVFVVVIFVFAVFTFVEIVASVLPSELEAFATSD